MFHIKKQLSRLYASSVAGNLSLTGAWVAILASRGFSLVEIGIAETVFHLTSLVFEIPSGVLADVLGRKKMLIISALMNMIGSAVMIASGSLFTVCIAIAFVALSYNFCSGSGDALAYDSLKRAGAESRFEKYESNQMVIYRLCGGLSTLCAGFALKIGHRLAYGTDLVMGLVQILILLGVQEVYADERNSTAPFAKRLMRCFRESFAFMAKVKKAFGLMLCNSLVGAADILLLFFLQAKLMQKGAPHWGLGMALLFMEMGGVVGSRLILKWPRLSYRLLFAVSSAMVLTGILAEHAAVWWVAALGGFLASAGDDALQVRTNALLQGMFPSGQRATLTSVESFSFSLVMIILSPLAGYFFTYW